MAYISDKRGIDTTAHLRDRDNESPAIDVCDAVRDQPITPEAVWAYCRSVATRYDVILKGAVSRARVTHAKLTGIVGSSERLEQALCSETKQFRQLLAVYTVTVRETVSHVHYAHSSMAESLNLVLASTVRAARVAEAANDLRRQHLVTKRLGVSTAARVWVRERTPTPEPLYNSEAMQHVSSFISDKAKEVSRVLACLVHGYFDLKKIMLLHQHVLQDICKRELRSDGVNSARYQQRALEELERQIQRLRSANTLLASRLPRTERVCKPHVELPLQPPPTPPPVNTTDVVLASVFIVVVTLAFAFLILVATSFYQLDAGSNSGDACSKLQNAEKIVFDRTPAERMTLGCSSSNMLHITE